MDKTKLLPIGAFAKLSGTNIKSLRYYDEIGVLPPAYVNPDTGYRYYALSQIHVVDAIQLCLELDIPLKQFPGFLDAQHKQIHYAKLLEQGQRLAQEKIRSIQARLDFLGQVQEDLQRSQQMQQSPENNVFPLPEKTCLTLPFAGVQNTADFYHVVGQLYQLAQTLGLPPRFEFGLLAYPEKSPQQYAFLEVDPLENTPAAIPQLKVLPATRYRFLQTEESCLPNAGQRFPQLFSAPVPQVVMEVEAVVEVGDAASPLFELRSSLP